VADALPNVALPATVDSGTLASGTPEAPLLHLDAITNNLDATTGSAPSYRTPAGAKPDALNPGVRIDDFEIISVLGAGAFAVVYLARQLSLDRQVALKVSANRGNEARTLASLEHEHIVRVFAETVEPARDRRLLCMQYVNGTTLERVLLELNQLPAEAWSGKAVLEIIDRLGKQPALFDPAALRDRELLERADWPSAVGWFGARVAEALAHAHSQGVLHRDIKPANILLNRYGRPLLADFNISFDPRSERSTFGGTVCYMAPEHLDAFNPYENTPPEAVDRRSDVYSLGVVLYEMLTGKLPYPMPAKPEGSAAQLLRQLAVARRQEAPAPGAVRPVPEVLDRVVTRCLQPFPEDRFPTADELARALDGSREHQRVMQELPPAGPLTRRLLRAPFTVGCLLMLLPHLLGSVVNISYNSLRIVDQLSAAQQAAFGQMVLLYNVLAYPACLALVVWAVTPVWRGWHALRRGALVSAADAALLRRQVLRLPLVALISSSIGWLPGGVLFPLGLQTLAGSCPPEVFGHFLVSFTVSGLIALTYSVYAALYVVLRVLYPQCWTDAAGLRRQARAELGPLARRLWVLQLLAGLIPLAGAILMVGVGPEDVTAGYRRFRLLVTTLIALGMVGFGVAMTLSGLLTQTLTALTGGSRKQEK